LSRDHKRDIEVAHRIVEVFLVHSWAEHLPQHEPQTKADRELEERSTVTSLARRKCEIFSTPRFLETVAAGSALLALTTASKLGCAVIADLADSMPPSTLPA